MCCLTHCMSGIWDLEHLNIHVVNWFNMLIFIDRSKNKPVYEQQASDMVTSMMDKTTIMWI